MIVRNPLASWISGWLSALVFIFSSRPVELEGSQAVALNDALLVLSTFTKRRQPNEQT
jgi:hypothetical protein